MIQNYVSGGAQDRGKRERGMWRMARKWVDLGNLERWKAETKIWVFKDGSNVVLWRREVRTWRGRDGVKVPKGEVGDRMMKAKFVIE